MGKIAKYIGILGALSVIIIIIIDNIVMPAYVRHREGRYMVNVINKSCLLYTSDAAAE